MRELEVPVCYDLRQADLIAGGEGAPLTPIADWVMYRGDTHKRVVVNLGGVCNISTLPVEGQALEIMGADVGPCNLLIDGLVQKLFPGERYDRDGLLSAEGVFADEISLPIEVCDSSASAGPKSAGREDYDAAWIDGLVEWAKRPVCGRVLNRHELLAAAIDTVAHHVVVSHVIQIEGAMQVVLAGGGARNPNLTRRIRDRLGRCIHGGREVYLSDDLGIPCESREAMGFAVLGALSQDGVPISLPRVTGATDPGVAGVWAGV